MTFMEGQAPLAGLRAQLLDRLGRHPLVVSAPTGAGKSTEVPRWCAGWLETRASASGEGPAPVLVIEPRRVACQSLARRVAELEGCTLGARVGYTVRDDDRSGPETLIRFVTPGVALRLWASDQLASFGVVIIDELHERSVDVDLLLALCLRRPRSPLVVMSATFAGDSVASHLKGEHLSVEGRRFEVEISYREDGPTFPSARGLTERVCDEVLRELQAQGHLDPEEAGDLLVFLPGKGEIYACERELRRSLERSTELRVELCPLHGSLSLEEQSRAFEPSPLRKVILSTNVAETSVTVPNVRVVIDGGLVRQTKYDRGRGALALTEVAQDSATQRAGRAGRVRAGRCVRLWQRGASLKPHTPPELHRASLMPLLLNIAACGERLAGLPFLDPPKGYAIDEAREALQDLRALDAEGKLTQVGRAIFSLGLDAGLGGWVVSARDAGPEVLADVIDLVSALSVRRALLYGVPQDEDDDLGLKGCDAEALIQALRAERSELGRLMIDPHAHREAQLRRRQLRDALCCEGPAPVRGDKVNRRRLGITLLKADPRGAYVARLRKRRVAWCGRGPDVNLSPKTALSRAIEREPQARFDALFALDVHAQGKDQLKSELWVSLAMPIELSWLREAGLGEDQLGEVQLVKGKIIASVERVFAKVVLSREERSPEGEAARQAIVSLIVSGRLWRGLLARVTERLERQALSAQLRDPTAYKGEEYEPVAWLTRRVAELGVEVAEDLELLEEGDLTPEALDEKERARLDKELPRVLKLSDAQYHLTYDLKRRVVLLTQTHGTRKSAPPPQWLPRFKGLEVRLKQGQHDSLLRARR